MLNRRSLLQSGAALSVLALHPLARAQAVPWPERPVKLINGFAAGGGF
jgi:tripartite-type tricarboxylate transporter receptor subunit TctC